MSKEEIKEGMENVAGGVKNETRGMGLKLAYGGPCIKIPKLPLGPLKPFKPKKQPEQPVDPLVPANPVQPSEPKKEENK